MITEQDADYAAGLAYRDGDFTRARQMIDAARVSHPEAAELWDRRHAAVVAAAHAAVPSEKGPRCPECMTAGLLPGRTCCQGCGALQALGRPTAREAAREMEPAS